jgi:hypothetical protein
MRKTKNFNTDAEALQVDDYGDDGFIEGDFKTGQTIASFSFGATSSAPTISIPKPADILIPEEQLYKINPRGITPPIDGEHFTLKRGYQLRPSTLRKLNELKAKHPDVNVYLNTILDAAIEHYYSFVIKENNAF